MTRRLLLLHPARLEGENRGIYEQHVASMRALLDGADGWQVHAVDPQHPSFPDAALSAGLVIIHMLAAAEAEAVIRLRRERGLATIFEIADNFLDLGPWLPPRHLLRNPLVRQRILHHASIADAVQVYAPGLAELFGHVNRKVIRLDPYVPIARVSRDDAFVVGWGGTTSHEEDLAPIAPVIVDFCRRHPDAVFAFIGNAALLGRLFAEIPRAQLRSHDFADYETYLRFVRQWDAGLAPMRPSGFNAGRSDTKFATYAACGVAALLEESAVYRPHADRAILFRTADELSDALEWLHEDRSRARDLASRAFAWAESERSADKLRAQRAGAYEPLLPDRGGAPFEIADDGPARRLAEAMGRQGAEQIEALRELVREHSGYAQARLALAEALRSAGDAAGALAVLDAQPFPPVLAGIAAERQLALALQMQSPRAAEFAARVDSPVARVRLSHGKRDRREFLRALLECQPFDYIALSTRLRELLAGGAVRSAELEELCLRACMIAPELVPVELRPPSLTRFLPA